jgi:hypothetical protein
VAILQIEHQITDYATWRERFDNDPVGRAEGGVTGFRVFRPVDGPERIKVDLEFATTADAEGFRERLERFWASGAASSVLVGEPRVAIVEDVTV